MSASRRGRGASFPPSPQSVRAARRSQPPAADARPSLPPPPQSPARQIYDAWSLVKVGLIRIRYGGPRPPPVCRSTSRPTIDLGILPDFPSVEEEFLTCVE